MNPFCDKIEFQKMFTRRGGGNTLSGIDGEQESTSGSLPANNPSYEKQKITFFLSIKLT